MEELKGCKGAEADESRLGVVLETVLDDGDASRRRCSSPASRRFVQVEYRGYVADSRSSISAGRGLSAGSAI